MRVLISGNVSLMNSDPSVRPSIIPENSKIPVQQVLSEVSEVLFPVVGVAASAGGLEAFIQLLSHLPIDTGMAFVLVQHRDPDQDHRQRQPLAHADHIGLSEDAVVWFAEELGDEAETAVTDQEYA